MKTIIYLLSASIITLSNPLNLNSQTSAMNQNEASAQILGAIALTATQSLEFGGIIPSASTAGTVVLSTSDARTGSNVALVASSVTPKSAAYSVSGTGLVSYTITLPTEPFYITNTAGTGHETMAVSEMTCSKGTLVGGSVHSVFNANGADSFKVGGTLHVGDANAQTAGYYTGTFTITVAY